MGKRQRKPDYDFLYIGCMRSTNFPGAPSRQVSCSACQVKIWLSEATESDVARTEKIPIPICMECAAQRRLLRSSALAMRGTLEMAAGHTGVSVDSIKKSLKANFKNIQFES